MRQGGTYKAPTAARRPQRGVSISRGRPAPEMHEWLKQRRSTQRRPIPPSSRPRLQRPARPPPLLREMMVERQLRPFDVSDLPVLQRFFDVPRELFLPAEFAPIAYSDLAIPGKGAAGAASRAIPAPLVLAKLLQSAEIRRRHKVLDVAGGAGYSAALLSGLAGEVVALESEPELAALARANLAKVGATQVRVECGPLEKGVPAAAPFDVILIHGAVEGGLDALFEQLAPMDVSSPTKGSNKTPE